MAFPVTVSVYDIGPSNPVSGAVTDPMGHRLVQHADAVIETHADGWKGTFLSYLPVDLGGLYHIETPTGATAQITVTATSTSETAFDGMGPCPFVDPVGR